MITIARMARPSIPPPEKMRLRTLAALGQSPLGPLFLARVESGRYNGRLVSIQRLSPRIEASLELRAIVVDEAWISALIANRNVAQFVTWGTDEEGTFLAVELVQGVPLSVLRRATLARRDIINDRLLGLIASEVCAGLSATHLVVGADGQSLNLRHGYLEPQNILITFRGEVKIAEFGLGHAQRRIQQALGEPLAAPSVYQPPSHSNFEGNEDLYAWGIILGEILAGRPPVPVPAQAPSGSFRISEPPQNTASLRRFVDPFFVDLSRACIEPKAGERPKSAFDILELFADWRAVRGFGEGDQESLARWSQSLGSAVLAWFRRASAGEFLRLSGAPQLCDVYVQAYAARPSESGKTTDSREARRSSSTLPPPLATASPTPPPPPPHRPARALSPPAHSASAEKRSEPLSPRMSGASVPASIAAPPFSRVPDERRAAPPSIAPPPLPSQVPPAPPSLSGAPPQASVSVPPVSSRFTFVSRWAVGNNEDTAESQDNSRTRVYATGSASTSQPAQTEPPSLRAPQEPSGPAENTPPQHDKALEQAPITLRTGSSILTHETGRGSTLPD